MGTVWRLAEEVGRGPNAALPTNPVQDGGGYKVALAMEARHRTVDAELGGRGQRIALGHRTAGVARAGVAWDKVRIKLQDRPSTL